jgi:DegV family protein with EDD domain
MSVGIVTDSGSDLYFDYENKYGIITVPLLFRFGMEEFPDKSIAMSDYLGRVQKTWPTTSAPSPGDYISAFNKSLNNHDQVICLTLSSKHSTSYTSAVLASQSFSNGKVMVIDSATLSIGQGYLLQIAAQSAFDGNSPEQIIEDIDFARKRSHLFISLDTIQFLVKGGRASQAAGVFAEVLRIRPILTIKDGQLTLIEKPRGRSASKQKMLELAEGNLPSEIISIGHVGCEGEGEELAVEMGQRSGIPLSEIPVIETGMAIATHGGPGTLGILVVSRR